MHATLTDPSGINITGETGHAIELAIDGEVFVLTDFYNSPEGDYRRGAIEFPLPELEPGAHEVRLKVWDNFNNSSRATVTVKVREGGDSGIANVLFYPNPMRDAGGHFTYELNENMSAVRIQVFSLAGGLESGGGSGQRFLSLQNSRRAGQRFPQRAKSRPAGRQVSARGVPLQQ